MPRCVRQSRHARFEHLRHVAAEDRARRDQRVDVTDAQHLADLSRTVRRRERHQQRADTTRREPRDHPLLTVGEVHTDPRPLADPGRHHPFRESSGVDLCFAVRHPSIGRDDEVVVTPVFDRVLQRSRNGRLHGRAPYPFALRRGHRLPRRRRLSAMRIGVFFPSTEHTTIDDMVERFVGSRPRDSTRRGFRRARAMTRSTLLAVIGRDVPTIELGTVGGADLSTAPHDAGGTSAHHQRRRVRSASPRHRPLAPGGGRTYVGSLVRAACPPHGGVPLGAPSDDPRR